MSKKKGSKYLSGELFIRNILIILPIALIMGKAFTMAMLSQTNIELESIKSSIEKQENVNSSLNMKINELASLDNVQEVALLYGLEYNNDNVRIID